MMFLILKTSYNERRGKHRGKYLIKTLHNRIIDKVRTIILLQFAICLASILFLAI